jgi:signal transduction histidine kinase
MKLRYWGFLIVCICFYLEGNAQQSNAQIKKIQTTNDYAYLSWGQQRLRLAKIATKLAIDAKYIPGLAESYIRMGQAYTELEQYSKGILYLKKGIAIRKSLGNDVYTANGFILLGHGFDAQHRFDSAQWCYQQSLWYYGTNMQISLVSLYTSYADSQVKAGHYSDAKELYQKAYSVYRQLLFLGRDSANTDEFSKALAILRINYAHLLQEFFQQIKAPRDTLLQALNQSAFFPQNDSTLRGICLLELGNNSYFAGDLHQAKQFYLRAKAYLQTYQNSTYAIVLKNLGRVYLDEGLLAESMKFYNQSKSIFANQRDTLRLAETEFEIGNFYYEQNLFDKATTHYLKALALQPSDAFLRGRVFFFLIDALIESDQSVKASYYERQLSQLFGQIGKEQGAQAFQLSVAYQMEKQRLLKNIKLTEHKALIQQYWLTILGFGILISLISFVLYLQWVKRMAAVQKAELAQQKEELAIHEKMKILQDKELETHFARLEAQEKVQQKIGQELHDDVGAILATVRMKLIANQQDNLQKGSDEAKQYALATQLLTQACDKVRLISHEFSDALLKKFGLQAQLEALRDSITETEGLFVELSTHNLNNKLGYSLELNVYRIVQELVHNVLKHAQASRVSIVVNHFDDQLNIIVEDNGIGFNTTAVQTKPGLGMLNLESRVHEVGGYMLLDSHQGKGTTIVVSIPLMNEKHQGA